jgi:hypothetical protein
MGFSFPFKEWLAKNEFVKDTLEAGSDNTRKNYKKFLAGDMHWSQLMTLVLFNKYRHG